VSTNGNGEWPAAPSWAYGPRAKPAKKARSAPKLKLRKRGADDDTPAQPPENAPPPSPADSPAPADVVPEPSALPDFVPGPSAPTSLAPGPSAPMSLAPAPSAPEVVPGPDTPTSLVPEPPEDPDSVPEPPPPPTNGSGPQLAAVPEPPEDPDEPRSSRLKLLTPLRLRDFRLLWTGMTVSLLGDGVFLVAIAWQVYQLSNAPTALSVVGIAMSVPHVVLLLLGGVVSDRFDRRKVMVFADLIRGVAIAVLGFLSVTGGLELWHVMILTAFYGAGTAFFGPAFDAIVPDVVPSNLLAEANSRSGGRVARSSSTP
jgi:hypothetical protein